MRGAIFEIFAAAELYKAFCHPGERQPLYFWRDRTGHEVDLVMDSGTTLIPIKIKSGETVNNSFFDGLRYFASLCDKISKNGVFIYGGDQIYKRDGFIVRLWQYVV